MYFSIQETTYLCHNTTQVPLSGLIALGADLRGQFNLSEGQVVDTAVQELLQNNYYLLGITSYSIFEVTSLKIIVTITRMSVNYHVIQTTIT